MKSKLVIVLAFVAACAAVFWLTRKKSDGERASAEVPLGAPSAPAPEPAVQIDFVYSTEKKEWIENALADFATANPAIRVNALGRGSLEAANAILDGKLTPAVWSPAGTLVLKLFENDWLTKNGGAAFGTDQDAPEPLVLSPIVFVAWEDRAKVLEGSASSISWKVIHKAVTSTQGWPAIKGNAEWGLVKIGHTDPTLSNSGLETLISIALEHFGKNSASELRVEDVLNAEFQTFLRQIEAGVGRFESSTGTFMTDMVRFGPSKYDIAVVYESSAIGELANAQGRWGNLRVYYPRVTLWSDHPIGLLKAPWVKEEQRSAAHKLIRFLRSRPIQERALRFGFRPGETSVPLKTEDAANPFTRLREYGLRADVPPASGPPEPAVTRNLLALWKRLQLAR
jgi:hypothetical protein